jgi:hypothetical protein
MAVDAVLLKGSALVQMHATKLRAMQPLVMLHGNKQASSMALANSTSSAA